jgi:hypothetical protein
MYYRIYNTREKEYLSDEYNTKSKERALKRVRRQVKFLNVCLLPIENKPYKNSDFVVENSIEKFDTIILVNQKEKFLDEFNKYTFETVTFNNNMNLDKLSIKEACEKTKLEIWETIKRNNETQKEEEKALNAILEEKLKQESGFYTIPEKYRAGVLALAKNYAYIFSNSEAKYVILEYHTLKYEILRDLVVLFNTTK